MNKFASLTLIAGLGALSLTACGGDNSGSASGFCDSIAKIEEDNVDPNDDFDGAMKALEDIKSNSPGELKDDLTTFIDVMTRLNDAGDDADFADFEGDFENMTMAVERIQDYADENCEDLPEGIFD